MLSVLSLWGCYVECFVRHLDRAAFLAISERFFADSFFARAGPPFLPPSLPRATAAGFFSGPLGMEEEVMGVSPVAMATTEAASWFGSRGILERLGMLLA